MKSCKTWWERGLNSRNKTNSKINRKWRKYITGRSRRWWSTGERTHKEGFPTDQAIYLTNQRNQPVASRSKLDRKAETDKYIKCNFQILNRYMVVAIPWSSPIRDWWARSRCSLRYHLSSTSLLLALFLKTSKAKNWILTWTL